MKKFITNFGILICLFMSVFVSAQSDLECVGRINSSAGTNCDFQLTADELMTTAISPLTGYEITIDGITALNTIILGPTVLNRLLTFSVRDTSTNVTCWGEILFEDGLIPQPECSTDTVQCTDDLSPLALGLPIPDSIMQKLNFEKIGIGSNCFTVKGWDSCSAIDLCFEDVTEALICDELFCTVIYRTWTVTDPNISPNKPATASCTDTIYIALPSKDSLRAPGDFLKPFNEISCNNLNNNYIVVATGKILMGRPSVEPNEDTIPILDREEDPLTGVTIETSPEVLNGISEPWLPLPYVTGSPIGLVCDDCVLSDWKDHVIEGTCSRFVERTWKIRGWCSNQNLDTTFVQKIKIVDDEAPIVTYCPDSVVLYVGSHDCTSSDPLPKPMAYDDCDNHQFTKGVNFSASTDKGIIVKRGDDYYLELDLNLYATDKHYAEANITWTIDDGCYNSTTCTYVARVVDNSPPVAICISNTQVSLSNDGFAKLFANQSFDNGSHDNCQSEVYFKVLRVSDEDVDNRKHGSSALDSSLFSCDGIHGDDDLDAVDIDSNQLGFEVFFDDFVKFCCEDVGTEQLVLLRVYDWLPVDYRQGPVSRSAHEEGGVLAGRFNDCWTTVLVEDKLGNLTCPADLYLFCTDHLPSSEATSSTACNNQDVELIDENDKRNSCGIGEVIRTYRTNFPNGSFQECEQKITVSDTDKDFYIVDTECPDPEVDGKNVDPKDGVTWPCDVILDCIGGIEDLSPDSLDSKPEIFDQIGDCSSVFVGSEDLILTQNEEACVKILRTWTVIDWCGDIVTGQQEAPGCTPNGQKPRWCYEQIVKVVDTESPVLSITMVMNCDSLEGCNAFTRLSVDAEDNCTALDGNRTGWTIYPDPALEQAKITGAGIVYEGFLPAGTHTIEFVGEDGCGNIGAASKEFTVLECKKPVPICNVGIGTVIMPSNGQVTIWAVEVDGGTKDDCSEITFGIRRVGDPTFTDFLILTCDDLAGSSTATVEVDMQVTDASGNSDFCTTFINLQDNSDFCGNGGSPISGTINTVLGISVENHPVQVVGAGDQLLEEKFTDANGVYGLFVTEGAKAVRPIKNDDAINGVNTLDLIAIQRHFLGIEAFDSPYKIIASDATNDKVINVLDLLELQEVILGLRSEFNNNQSWRYVSSTEEMTMESAYFFEEPKDITGMSADEMKVIDFIAVKIGDVNGTVDATGVRGSEVSSRSNLELKVDASQIEYGSEIRIPVRSSNFTDVEGYQYTLSYDVRELEFVGIESGVLNIGEDNVMTARSSEGMVSTNWYVTQAQTHGSDEVLYTLVMRGERLTSLSLNSSLTNAESYRAGSTGSVSLEISARNADEAFALYQNTPNPFNDRTMIGFYLPSGSETTLSVYDVSGKQVHRAVFDATKGYNAYALNMSGIHGVTGVLYYRIETKDFTATKKMVAY